MTLLRKLSSLALLTLLLSVPARAVSVGDGFGLSPFWDWKTIETPHFRVTFPKELELQAQKVAQYYEEANAFLSQELNWQPTKMVNVLLVDNTDAANGLSTPVLRFGMLLYITPPENWFSTSYYDDWLKLLVFHEYTHFLNMDPTRGVYTFLRFLFGDVFMPNTLWPTWMIEGLAVYEETKHSQTGGRGRSTYYEMVLRTAVENGKLGASDWMNLSRLNSPNPWYPSGESPYLFGYQLMNEVSKADPKALGEMSMRSSWRVPFFINGNLENITGKDWYQFWDSFVARAKKKAEADLAKIRSQPVTKAEVLDDTHDEALGATLSPDEKHLAYSYEDEHRWQKLRLRDMTTGETKEIEDKFLGVGMSFTPDSKTLIYSSFRKVSNYYFLSDLRAYDLSSGDTYWLTKKLRAKDPDVSRDGKWVVFTQTAGTGVHLQLAKLVRKGDRWMITESRRLVTANALDRISNPRFSPDQHSVVYSLKINGTPGERLMRYVFSGGKVETLVADANYNRYPTFDRAGTLHFISNRTGVENLYRWDGRSGVQVTNLSSGVILPTFASNAVYGSVFTHRGWGLGKIARDQLTRSYDSASLTIAPAEAPPHQPTPPHATQYEVKDYSPWSTLAPRQWAPLVLTREEGGYVGAQASGYDQTLEHQYILGGAYDYGVKTFDYIALYQNRTLGVNIDLYATRLTSGQEEVRTNPPQTLYSEDFSAGAAISFPFQFTTAILEPTLSASVEMDKDIAYQSGTRTRQRTSRNVPVQDFTLTYTDARTSRLAVAPERGRRSLIGVRRYDDDAIVNYKYIAKHVEHLHLGKHWVLSPTVRGVKVNRQNLFFLDGNANFTGNHSEFLNLLPGDNFDEFGIRGYPRIGFVTDEAYSASLDLDIPLAQIFRGWGTNPIVLNQLTMGLFGELTYLPSFRSDFKRLPSVGASLRLNTQWVNILPLSFAVEYERGLNRDAFGEDEIYFTINVSRLPYEF